MTRRFWSLSLWLILGVALLVSAYLLINTTFMIYDDEGYLLLTYKNFLSGARLYDDVFSQYGPWPYLYHQVVVTLLHQPLTHSLSRDITAFHWVLCALLCGIIVIRTTGRSVVAVCATLIIFDLLWQMNSEPSHPGSLIAAMLATAALLAVIFHRAGRWYWLGASLGITAALLVLTKINVGLLFITGASVGALRLTAWPERWRRPAGILATLGLLAVPWGLMGKKLGEPWVLYFAIQFTAGAAGLIWVTPPALIGRPVPPRTWGVALGIFVATIVSLVVAVCVQGTSLSALLQTVLIAPLRQPASFMFGFTWPPEIWPVATFCWLTTGWAGWELRQKEVLGSITRHLVILVRLVVLVVFIINTRTWLTIDGVTGFIVFCLPVLPLFLVPIGRGSDNERKKSNGHLWVAVIALPQVLHAFPVAGSQMCWGTFLLLPVMILGLDDAWCALGEIVPKIGRWLPRLGWGALLLASGWQFELLAANGWLRYTTSKPLNLAGGEDIRLDGPSRLTLRVLTINASVHAETLFSRPGMFSYNMWSGVPTPTAQNATHWFWLLDEPAQNKIIEKLRITPRSVIITNQYLDDFLKRIKVPTQGPLDGYIREKYRPLFDVNNFYFLVPRASHAVPFGIVDLRSLNEADVGGKLPTLLRTNVVLDGEPAVIQLISAYAPWKIATDYSGQGSRIFLEPITSEGELIGPAIQLPVHRRVQGLFRMTIFASEVPKVGPSLATALTVMAPDGAVLSESIF